MVVSVSAGSRRLNGKVADKELVMGRAVCAWWGWSQPA